MLNNSIRNKIIKLTNDFNNSIDCILTNNSIKLLNTYLYLVDHKNIKNINKKK